MAAGNQSNQAPEGKLISNRVSLQAGINRAAPLESYEKELSNALRWARTVASLHAISRFLAFCNLTWASVVLLGAFAPDLLPFDFIFVACLLLLEAVRLAYPFFFTGLYRCALSTHLSQDPKHIVHGKDGVRCPASRIWSQILQFILISPSFIIPSIRIFALSFGYDPKIRNLENSLCIFYSFVAFSALVALIGLMCSALAFVSLNKPPEQSILRYYDKVLENAMSRGVVQADDFEFFRFAYTMLGREYRRNVQPEAVAKNYKKLIQYLYAHRLGLDFLQIYLDADDAFVQLAAVNMVGFWADTAWGVGLKELKLPGDQLLGKLADKVGTGQVGWAATSSFGVLARKPGGACLVATTRTSSGRRLPDQLADLVDAASSRSLSLVRTLASFYEQLCVNEKEPPKPFAQAESSLAPKLKKLAEGAKVQRLRVQAAYLLLMMGEECDPSVIEAIDPTQDSYWFQSEVSILHLLRQHIPYHVSPLQLQGLSIRNDADITPPPWTQPTIPASPTSSL